NFPTITVDIDQTVLFSSATTLSAAVSLPTDTRVDRRKAWLDYPTNTEAAQFLRIMPTGTPDDGASYYELGVAACLESPVTMPNDHPVWPYRYTRHQAVNRVGYPSGAEDVSEHGVPYLEFTLQNPAYLRGPGLTTQDTLFSIVDAGQGGPVIFWENLGQP